MPEQAGVNEPGELRSIIIPHVEPVCAADCGEVQPVVQPQAHEDRLLGLHRLGARLCVDTHRGAVLEARDVFAGAGDVVPAGPAPCGMRTASEPEPRTVLPILQVVP